MAQQLGTLVALTEDEGLIPSTYPAAHNSLSPRGFSTLSWPQQATSTQNPKPYKRKCQGELTSLVLQSNPLLGMGSVGCNTCVPSLALVDMASSCH